MSNEKCCIFVVVKYYLYIYALFVNNFVYLLNE